MKNHAAVLFSLALALGDFLALLAAFSVAYILRVKFDPRPLIEQIPALTYFSAFFIVLPLWILVNASLGLYTKNVYERRVSEFGRLLLGSFLGILIVIGYDFVVNGTLFPARLVAVYGFVIGFGFLLLFRIIARMIRRFLFLHNTGISNVLLIGNTDATASLARALSPSTHTGQRILATVGRIVKPYKHYEDFSTAVQRLRTPINSIIQTELYSQPDRNNEILRYAQEHHAAYRFIPANNDLFVGKIDVELFAGLPVVAVHQTPLIGWGRIVKRLFDLVVTATLLVIISPLFLLIMLAELLFGGRGGIFFSQTRLTRHNREFKAYKFRTVKKRYNGITPEEAFEKMGKPELSKEFRDNGNFLIHDPRFSGLGRFLRRTSLDELPQLINVLKGDISLVGPRALVPKDLSSYEKRHAILSVKSGVTGLAQVSGRNNISFDERRKLDVYYVQNWTFWMDLGILIRTIRVLFSGS